jgi:hypothetical protein
MSKKSVIASILGVVVLAGGIIAGVMLVRQQQELREKAAVPGGQARVSLFPTSGSFNVGDNMPVSIYFNTSGVSISSIRLRLVYPFSGTSPEITASDIEINQIIEKSGNWNCPTKSITTEGQNIAIDVACANIGATGYSTNLDTLLASFKLTVNKIPQTNPFTLRFDPSMSIITQKSNGQDILNVPDSETATASFTVVVPSGPSPTPTKVLTPTPTKKPTATPTPTKIPTATPTVKLTTTPTTTLGATVTPTKKITPTPTSAAQLPDAGYAWPSYIGLGLGLILIVTAVFLAL